MKQCTCGKYVAVEAVRRKGRWVCGHCGGEDVAVRLEFSSMRVTLIVGGRALIEPSRGWARGWKIVPKWRDAALWAAGLR